MNFIKYSRLFILFLMHLYAFNVDAQHAITKDANKFRCDDKLTMQAIEPFPIGDAGENVDWCISGLASKGEYNVSFSLAEDSTCLEAVHPQKMFKYKIDDDTLKCVGFETPQRYMEYLIPQVVMIYPFSFGDVINNSYKGEGFYCGTNRIWMQGDVIVESDGYGRLIIDEDTIYDVLRTHTVRTSSMNMNLLNDTTIFDPNNQKMEIQESYAWYGRGCRYPLLESRTVSLYNNQKLFSTVMEAYSFLPQNQHVLNDSVNKRIIQDEGKSNKQIIHYNVVSQNGEIRISYTLDENAKVSVLLSDRMGIVYRNYAKFQNVGRNYEVVFNCDGLKSGVYILYISANGHAFSEKVNI